MFVCSQFYLPIQKHTSDEWFDVRGRIKALGQRPEQDLPEFERGAMDSLNGKD